jgi:hypothetical protein
MNCGRSALFSLARCAKERGAAQLKFQPNSIGKIIVNGSGKAALLEFSGFP